MQVLINLFLIYIATNVEWFLHVVDIYFIHSTNEILSSTLEWNNYTLFGPFIETAVFAGVYYALTYQGLLKIKSRAVLAIAVIGSDILYIYAYQPLLDKVNIEILQEHFALRAGVFIVAYALLLILFSYAQNSSPSVNRLAEKLLPPDECATNFFKHYGVIFLAGLATIAVAMTLLQLLLTALPELVEGGAFDWQSMVLLGQVLPIVFSPIIYLILFAFTAVRKRQFDNLKDTALSGIFAYLLMFLFLVPISGIMAAKGLSGVSGAAFFFTYTAVALALGMSIYIFRDVRWYKLIFQIIGIIVGVLLGLVLVSNLFFGGATSTNPEDCAAIASNRASKAMTVQELAKQKADYDSYYKTFYELCTKNSDDSVTSELDDGSGKFVTDLLKGAGVELGTPPDEYDEAFAKKIIDQLVLPEEFVLLAPNGRSGDYKSILFDYGEGGKSLSLQKYFDLNSGKSLVMTIEDPDSVKLRHKIEVGTDYRNWEMVKKESSYPNLPFVRTYVLISGRGQSDRIVGLSYYEGSIIKIDENGPIDQKMIGNVTTVIESITKRHPAVYNASLKAISEGPLFADNPTIDRADLPDPDLTR